jgi:hypothetical protein
VVWNTARDVFPTYGHSRENGNPELGLPFWMPAFAPARQNASARRRGHDELVENDRVLTRDSLVSVGESGAFSTLE